MHLDLFDQQLEIAGGFGPAQFLLIAFATYSEMIISWISFLPVFLTIEVNFKCKSEKKFDNNTEFSSSNSTEMVGTSVCAKQCEVYT